MAYLVLARKYRPQTFDDLVGQEHIAKTLTNALEAKRSGEVATVSWKDKRVPQVIGRKRVLPRRLAGADAQHR